MFKKINIIKAVLGVGLRPYGFDYYKTYHNIWIFMRKKQEVEQYIAIDQSQFDQAIRLELYTSVDEFIRYDIDEFYPNYEEKCGKYIFWPFTDKESFIKILNMFLEIIIEAGLDKLNELSVVDENKIILNEEMFRELYNKHDELCEKFIKTYKVSINDITLGIKRLYELYEEHKNDNIEDVNNLLIEMAAYYGNSFCAKVNGKWVWEYDSCLIILHASYGKDYLFPFQSIVSCWNNNDKSNYLMELHNELL